MTTRRFRTKSTLTTSTRIVPLIQLLKVVVVRSMRPPIIMFPRIVGLVPLWHLVRLQPFLLVRTVVVMSP